MTLAELKERVDRLVSIIEYEMKDDPENFDIVVPSVFDDGFDYIEEVHLEIEGDLVVIEVE